MEGPDHSSSLNPAEFRELVNGIRNIEKALGTGIKKPSQAEIDNSFGMKRSLVLLTDLEAGTILTESHIGFKRPSNGLPPNMLGAVIGKPLSRQMKKDEALQYNSINW
jgi:N,N'-diacetyllegionaminate synthase